MVHCSQLDISVNCEKVTVLTITPQINVYEVRIYYVSDDV